MHSYACSDDYHDRSTVDIGLIRHELNMDNYWIVELYYISATARYSIRCDEFAYMFHIVERLRSRLIEYFSTSERPIVNLSFSEAGDDIPLAHLFAAIDKHNAVGQTSS